MKSNIIRTCRSCFTLSGSVFSGLAKVYGVKVSSFHFLTYPIKYIGSGKMYYSFCSINNRKSYQLVTVVTFLSGRVSFVDFVTIVGDVIRCLF